jgi:hypothetical protein
MTTLGPATRRPPVERNPGGTPAVEGSPWVADALRAWAEVMAAIADVRDLPGWRRWEAPRARRTARGAPETRRETERAGTPTRCPHGPPEGEGRPLVVGRSGGLMAAGHAQRSGGCEHG